MLLQDYKLMLLKIKQKEEKILFPPGRSHRNNWNNQPFNYFLKYLSFTVSELSCFHLVENKQRSQSMQCFPATQWWYLNIWKVWVGKKGAGAKPSLAVSRAAALRPCCRGLLSWLHKFKMWKSAALLECCACFRCRWKAMEFNEIPDLFFFLLTNFINSDC